ncbi:MAG: hypothetical protein FWE35_27845 [Streptosporangiales bacterium]|nr:hypothetical protein [Streptosporangiales bacterium]
MVSRQQAYDPQGPYGYPTPPEWQAPPERVRGRGAAVVFWIALAGFAAAAVGVGIQVFPRHFSAAQQQQIMAWEVQGRWHDLPAARIFPSRISYAPPSVLNDIGSSLTLKADRLGVARQAPCRKATDPAAAAILARGGCQAVLRATFTDATDTYVATVGVAPLSSAGQAQDAQTELGAKNLRMSDGRAPGVRTASFPGTPASGFTDNRRQLSGSVVSGSYLVMYAVGYTDDRALVPVSSDSYAKAEMTSFARGVAASAADTLGTPPPPPHCPGAPGC